MSRLTKQYLQDLEAYEYKQLKTLQDIKTYYEKEGKTEDAERVEKSIKHQMGRWGIISELLETFGIDEKLN